MAITYLTPTTIGDTTLVTVTSDIGGTVYYHWYRDGSYAGMTMVGERRFRLPAGYEVEIVCQDTADQAYDPIANAPDGAPPTMTLQVVSSPSTDVARYRIEQQRDGGSWTAIAILEDDGDWWWLLETEPLVDLSTYSWRAVPIDVAGNDGTPLTIGTAKVVRRPSAVNWSPTFNAGTNRMTFSAVT